MVIGDAREFVDFGSLRSHCKLSIHVSGDVRLELSKCGNTVLHRKIRDHGKKYITRKRITRERIMTRRSMGIRMTDIPAVLKLKLADVLGKARLSIFLLNAVVRLVGRRSVWEERRGKRVPSVQEHNCSLNRCPQSCLPEADKPRLRIETRQLCQGMSKGGVVFRTKPGKCSASGTVHDEQQSP